MLTFVPNFTAAGKLVHSLGPRNDYCSYIESVVCTLTYGCCAQGELAGTVQIHILETYF